jgi:hypothetical protein
MTIARCMYHSARRRLARSSQIIADIMRAVFEARARGKHDAARQLESVIQHKLKEDEKYSRFITRYARKPG